MHVCLLGKAFGLADAIARALGSDFEVRHRGDLELNQWTDWREWFDVVVLDMRPGGTDANLLAGIHLMEEIQQSVSRPSIVAFCDENKSAFAARVMELGAYDTITDGLSITELRQILRRAHKIRTTERELETLRASTRN